MRRVILTDNHVVLGKLFFPGNIFPNEWCDYMHVDLEKAIEEKRAHFLDDEPVPVTELQLETIIKNSDKEENVPVAVYVPPQKPEIPKKGGERPPFKGTKGGNRK